MRKLKRILIVIIVLAGLLAIHVEIVNRNSKNMTYRQKILKAVYPAFMWMSKWRGKHSASNPDQKTPPVSFYTLGTVLNNGQLYSFDQLRGKKVLIVNTASNCGYTRQYEDLQKLWEQHKEKLVLLGFPANDFKQQEKGTDEEIASFCKLNYGVDFPLMKKTQVVSGAGQHPVYKWLTDPRLNGWNAKAPEWNFSKYLVDEQGRLTHYFGPSVEPLGPEILAAIK